MFGCRGEQADFYYRHLWQQLIAEGVLAAKDGLLTAFSRDQQQKVYVQDKLRQHGQLMWDLLDQVGFSLMQSVPYQAVEGTPEPVKLV